MAESHRRRWLTLPILCLSVFLVVVDNTIVNVALPTLSTDLGASTTGLQWIVDAYSLAFAGLLLAGGGIGGPLGEKRGHADWADFLWDLLCRCGTVAQHWKPYCNSRTHGRGGSVYLPSHLGHFDNDLY
ncbi:unannotated protein [freshwater metagenome]|uniref:Unannotated protein n=1 Tax=freshwater metagenome TaxID=449393 RepID=A0A6J7RTL9_9ZZZZ